jgi:hypothetical protein
LDNTFTLPDALLDVMGTLGDHIPDTRVVDHVGRTPQVVGIIGAVLDALHHRLLILHVFTAFPGKLPL